MADYLRLKGSSSKEILAQLAEARKKLPDDPESLYVEGMMWAGLKEDHRAEALLTDALKQTQARYSQILVRAAIELGMIYFKAGSRNEARSQVEAVFQHNRNHQWARNLLESITALSEPTAIAKVNSQSGTEDGLNSATVGRDGGRPIETGSGGGQSHEGIHGGQGGAPNTYEGLVKEGNKLSERGHTMQAMKFFQRALELKPNGVEALTGLGYCHLDQERFAAALASFKRALNLVPADGDAMIGMAEAYKVQGNLAKALDYYRAYLQAYPAGRKAILARQNVTELERQIGGTPSGTTTSPPPSAPPPSAPPASGEAPPTSGTAPESGNISGNPETSAP
jgi:tetratricopeptide (TPR) repeat protein